MCALEFLENFRHECWPEHMNMQRTYVYSAHKDQWELELQMVVSFHEGVDTGPKSNKHCWAISLARHVFFNRNFCLQIEIEEPSLLKIHRSTCSPSSQLEEFPVGSWDSCVSVQWGCKCLDPGYAFSVACCLQGSSVIGIWVPLLGNRRLIWVFIPW